MNKNWSFNDWWGYDLSHPSSVRRLINKIERIVRMTPEYKTWADSKRRGCTHCPKCGIEREIDPIEVHHDKETLYEIVENIIDKHIENDETYFINNMTPLRIIEEVIKLHLDDKVSYKLLCSSCHKRIHNERKNTE